MNFLPKDIENIINDYKQQLENLEKDLYIITSRVYLYYDGEPEYMTTLVSYGFYHNNKKGIEKIIKDFCLTHLKKQNEDIYKIKLKEIMKNIKITRKKFDNEKDKINMLLKNEKWDTNYPDERDIQYDYISILKNENGNFVDYVNIYEMNIKELKRECKLRGIKGFSKLKKNELIKLLE